MDDLVEHLRGLADCDARAGEPLGKCMREAADEIERLREELARRRTCSACNGTGSRRIISGDIPCDTCFGRGH